MSSDRQQNKAMPEPFWWGVTGLLLIGIAAAAFLLFQREPETQTVEVPSTQVAELSPEVLAEIERLKADAAALRSQATDVLQLVIAYDCPPGTEVSDPAQLAALKSEAGALLKSLR